VAAKTIEMRSARRRSQAKKAAAASAKERPSERVPFPLFVNHGRAWINGDEVGGSDPRFAHLDRSYD
jgi:hypothetical protein